MVNIGANVGKRMPVKVFLKNTMDLVDGMLEKDEVLKAEVEDSSEAVKKWKKGLEAILKVIDVLCRICTTLSKIRQ
jgi:hypothetical protein